MRNITTAPPSRWVALPCDLDEVREKLAENTGEDADNMEIFINDYETSIDGIDIDEGTYLEELNKTAETLDGLEEYELEELQAITEVVGDFSDALNIFERDSYTYYSGMTLEDLAYQLVNEGCFGNISQSIQKYIDYAAIARDLDFDGYTETESGVIRID